MIPWELLTWKWINIWRLSLIFPDSSNCKSQRLFGKFTWSDNNNVTDLSAGNNFLPKRAMNQGLLPSMCGWLCLTFVDEPKHNEFSVFKRSKWHLVSKWVIACLRKFTCPQRGKKFCYPRHALADAIQRSHKDCKKQTNMAWIQRSFYLLNARTICAICLHN